MGFECLSPVPLLAALKTFCGLRETERKGRERKEKWMEANRGSEGITRGKRKGMEIQPLNGD